MAPSPRLAGATICARFRSSSPSISRWQKSAPCGPRKLLLSASGRRNADEVRTAARRLRRDVNSPFNPRRMHEMFAHMRNTFEEQRFMPDRNVIEEHEMLMNLPHVSDVRHHRQPEFPRQQAHCNKLRNSREPRAIRLHEMQRASLHVVLE